MTQTLTAIGATGQKIQFKFPDFVPESKRVTDFLNSLSRINCIMLIALNAKCLQTELERGTISRPEKLDLDHIKRMLAEYGTSITLTLSNGDQDLLVGFIEREVGEAYQRMMTLIQPWRVIWDNIHNTMFVSASPHPIYGFPVPN